MKEGFIKSSILKIDPIVDGETSGSMVQPGQPEVEAYFNFIF